MHIAIDGVGNHVGGGWSVLTRTVRQIADDNRVSRVSVFCSPLEIVASDPPTDPKIHWLQHPWSHRRIGRLEWHRYWLDRAVKHVDADVLLTMNGVGRTTRPTVALVQQAFMVWGKLRRVRPRLFAAKLAVLRREFAKSVHEAQAVVVQTSWMQQQVQNVCGRQAAVLPLGLPVAMTTTPSADATHVVVVGHDLPYKRLDVIREAVTEVPLEVIDDAHPDEVTKRLAAASALIVASDVESFGLPIVEAFAAGCPVVLTDRPWARAVAGDAANYFEHGVAASAARRVREVTDSRSLTSALRERGRTRLAELWEDAPYTRLVGLLEDVA